MKSADIVVLKIWAEVAPFRIARRAWLVLEYLTGKSTKTLATSVAMTEQRVQEVIDRYKDMGLMGLFEMPRKGRPEKEHSEKLNKINDREEGVDVFQIAKGLNKSIDWVWREARLGNWMITRQRKRVFNIPLALSKQLPVVAILLASEYQIIVVAEKINTLRHLSINTLIDGLSKEIIEILEFSFKSDQKITFESLINVSNLINISLPIRADEERRQRVIRNLDWIERVTKSSLKFYICGNIQSDSLNRWIKSFQQSEKHGENTKLRYSFFSNIDKSLEAIKMEYSIDNYENFWREELQKKLENMQGQLIWYVGRNISI